MIDHEIDAIRKVVDALSGLDRLTVERIISYCNARIESDRLIEMRIESIDEHRSRLVVPSQNVDSAFLRVIVRHEPDEIAFDLPDGRKATYKHVSTS